MNKPPLTDGICTLLNRKLSRKDLGTLPFTLSPKGKGLLEGLYDKPILSSKLPSGFTRKRGFRRVRGSVNRKFEGTFGKPAIIGTDMKGEPKGSSCGIYPVGLCRLNPELFEGAGSFEIGKDCSWEELFTEKQVSLIKALSAKTFLTYSMLGKETGLNEGYRFVKNINRLCEGYGLPAAIEYTEYPKVTEGFKERVGLRGNRKEFQKLGDFFTENMVRMIEYIVKNPSTTPASISKGSGVSYRGALDGAKRINGRCERYDLPLAIKDSKDLCCHKYVITPEFARMFNVAISEGQLLHLFSEQQNGLVKFLLENPRSSPKDVIESVGTGCGRAFDRINEKCEGLGLPKAIDADGKLEVRRWYLTEEFVSKFGLSPSKNAKLSQFFTSEQTRIIGIIGKNPGITYREIYRGIHQKDAGNARHMESIRMLIKRIRKTCTEKKLPKPFSFNAGPPYSSTHLTLREEFAAHFSSADKLPKTDVPIDNGKESIKTRIVAQVPKREDVSGSIANKEGPVKIPIANEEESIKPPTEIEWMKYFTLKQNDVFVIIGKNPGITYEGLRGAGVKKPERLIKRIREACVKNKLPKPFSIKRKSSCTIHLTLNKEFATYFSVLVDERENISGPIANKEGPVKIPIANEEELIKTLTNAQVPTREIEIFLGSICFTAEKDNEPRKTRIDKIAFDPLDNSVTFSGTLRTRTDVDKWHAEVGKISEKGFVTSISPSGPEERTYKWEEFNEDPLHFVYVKVITETKTLPSHLREEKKGYGRKEKKLSVEDWICIEEIVRSMKGGG
jgi:hypothetical protein